MLSIQDLKPCHTYGLGLRTQASHVRAGSFMRPTFWPRGSNNCQHVSRWCSRCRIPASFPRGRLPYLLRT